MIPQTLLNYKRKNGALTVKRPGQYKLNWVIKVTITRAKTDWHHVLSEAIHRKSSASLLINSCQDSMVWVGTWGNTGWTQNEEHATKWKACAISWRWKRLRKGSRLKETKETWLLNTSCQPGSDTGPEKRQDIFGMAGKICMGPRWWCCHHWVPDLDGYFVLT